MIKSLDQISEAIHSSKLLLHQVDDRPNKPQKHRYERRKIKEYIKISDWTSDQSP